MADWIPWTGLVLGLAAGAAFAGFWLWRRQKALPGPEINPAPSLPSRAPTDKARVPLALQGTLSQVPVHDFLQFLAQGGRTGLLEVVSGRRHGYARMQEGQIVFAVFRGRHGLTALHAMLTLTEGDYEFIEGHEVALPAQVEPGPPQSPLDVVEVLLQWETKRRNESST